MKKKTREEILKEFPMLVKLGENERKNIPGKTVTSNKRREICDFARDHHLVIHPGGGYDYYIESFFMFNCCPCDQSRKNCPCEEAVQEVARDGHCKCRLFWRSYLL